MADNESRAENFEFRISNFELPDLRRRLFTFDLTFSVFAFLLFTFFKVLKNLYSLVVRIGHVDPILTINKNSIR